MPSSNNSFDSYDMDEGDIEEGFIATEVKPTAVVDTRAYQINHSPEQTISQPDTQEPPLETFQHTESPSKQPNQLTHYRTSEASSKLTERNRKQKSVNRIAGENSAKFQTGQAMKIPVVTKLTTRNETYDLEYLMNPAVQKNAQSGTRFNGSLISSELSSPKKPTKDFLKRNKEILRKSKIELNSSKELPQDRRTITQSTIDKRFDKYAKDVADKVNRLSTEIEARRKSECSFQPKISKTAKQRPRRNATDFYLAMKEFKSQRDEKVSRMVVDKEQSDLQGSKDSLTFKPTISTYSEKLKREGSIFDRLYNMPHKNTADKNVDESAEQTETLQITTLEEPAVENCRPFVPTVNKVSQEIVRDKSIVDHLYEDAVRRMKKPQPVVVTTSQKLISDKSEQFLIEKLEAEFLTVCAEIDPETDKLNYSQLSELLQRMFFIKNNVSDKRHKEERDLILKVWKLLKGEENQSVHKLNLLIFLNGVMSYTTSSMSLPEMSEEDKSLLIPNKLGVWYKEYLYIKPEEVYSLHHKYELLYLNRVAVKNKSNVNRTFKEEPVYSFRPAISAISKNLTTWRSKSNENFKRIEDYLIDSKKCTQKRKEQLTKEIEQNQQIECSFAPKVGKPPKVKKNKKTEKVKETLGREYIEMMKDPEISAADKNEVLFRLGKISKQRKEKLIAEAEKQKEKDDVKGCTFAPCLEESRKTMEQDKSIIIKGVDQTLERIKKAREMKNWLEFAKQKGFTNSKLVSKLKQENEKESSKMINYHSVDQIKNEFSLVSPNKSLERIKHTGLSSSISSINSSISYTPIKSPRSVLESHNGKLSGSDNEEIEETIVVDVSLGNGVVKQLHINPEDNLEDCARKFIIDNNIPISEGEKLIKQLKDAFN